MKKHSLIFFVTTVFALIAIVSCKKINEATDLGGDLIPAVDNVTTFEKFLDVETDNRLFNDTTRYTTSDYGALGTMNDGVFGTTRADLYFNLSSSAYGTYPYIINPSQSNDPSVFQIDSVVMQLAYKGNYGDSTSEQTIQVYELPTKISGFTDSTYKNFVGDDLPTIGSSLGATSFIPSKLKDSIRVINKTDTFRVANVVRFRLDGAEALARKFASYDTTAGSNEGFRRDSAFKQLFGGLAVKSTSASGKGGLSYFNLNDTSTKFIIYFKAIKSTGTESGYFNYFHTSQAGNANIIHRNRGGDFAAALASAATNDP
ncbi:MAG TPA: DUF4270 family protein, partial [Flavisolibacter sp.]|nr:DUF4270 family protein [Flavisolibacter sp.]